MHDNCTITGIYHNTTTKETFSTSLLYNSEVDYFSDSFIFNDIVSKYNLSKFKETDDINLNILYNIVSHSTGLKFMQNLSNNPIYNLN